MSFLDSYLNNDDDLPVENQNIDEEIKRIKELVEYGNLYSSVESVEEMVQFCIERERYEDGLFLSSKLLEIFPYNSEYWLKKGISLNGLFRFDEALLCYSKSLSLNPWDSEALIDKAAAEENLGLYDQARESLDNVLINDPRNEEALFSIGLLLQRQDKFDSAVKYFRNVQGPADVCQRFVKNTPQLH